MLDRNAPGCPGVLPMVRRFFLFSCALCATLVSGESSKPDQLFITISSLEHSAIELNWEFHGRPHPDIIELYRSNPAEDRFPIAAVKIEGVPKGRYAVNVTFTDTTLPTQWQMEENFYEVRPGAHCLNLWVSARSSSSVLSVTHVNCLKIQPTWMKDNGERIGNVPLSRLFIPGTHNSACYDGLLSYKTVNDYVLNQNQDVWTQLVFGVRYLDLRIGYYSQPDHEEFWIYHDMFKITPLTPVLRQIAAFVNRSRDEVIILDIHRFPTGFKQNGVEKHRRLIRLLEKELGNMSVPNSYQVGRGPTLRDLWRTNKRIITCYGEDQAIGMAIYSKWLWQPLKQLWGNQQTVRGLKNYLRLAIPNAYSDNSNPLTAAMAELTPNSALVFFGLVSSEISLGHLANLVNRNVTEWFRDDWSQLCNIVATDFFLGNDIVDVAIRSNLRK